MRKALAVSMLFLTAVVVTNAQTKPRGVSLGVLGGIVSYGFVENGSCRSTLYAGGGITVDGKILKNFGLRADILAGGDVWSNAGGTSYSSQVFHYANVSLGIAPYYEWNFERFHFDLGAIVDFRVRIPENDTRAVSMYVMTVACSVGPYFCFKYDITDHLQISAHYTLCATVYDYIVSRVLSGYSHRLAGSSALNAGLTWQF